MTTTPPTTSLTLTEVLLIHELLIETFGGMRGVTEHGFGKLEGALAAPDVSMFGEDLYPDLPSKAAALFFRLARAHGFSDGNKRVALVGLLSYLECNRARLMADQEALYEFTMAAASDAYQSDIAEWIGKRLVVDGD
ncbi:MAG: type II toxin-antitoxin system death-on-curing family toxin [Chloroflexota bacterium]|nr:type II toxin-antitoxin system death-on-curing family toxin [Chloroflexota bacterium]